MDAPQLLAAAAQAYENLESLSAAIVCVNESGDQDSFKRSEQRSKAYYQKPDKVRLEQGGARGSVYVSDGAFFHSYFSYAKRYSKQPFVRRDFIPAGSERSIRWWAAVPNFCFIKSTSVWFPRKSFPNRAAAWMPCWSPTSRSQLARCSRRRP
jgi:hypothetical protein